MEDVPQNILLIVQVDLASKVNEFDIFLLKKEEEYIDITKKKTHTHTHTNTLSFIVAGFHILKSLHYSFIINPMSYISFKFVIIYMGFYEV